MNKGIFYLSAIFIIVSITILVARSTRTSKIPHAGVNSCGNCHESSFGGGPRNSFGQAVEDRVSPNGEENFWGPELAALDSDGDGYTNGEELQDPKGAWQYGDTAPGDPALVSNPGNAASTPGSDSSVFPYFSDYEYKLFDNYPNPVKTHTQIVFSLAIPGLVNISIYNGTGELVIIIVDKFMLDGIHEINWNLEVDEGSIVKPGIYFIKMTAGNFTKTKKMVILKSVVQ